MNRAVLLACILAAAAPAQQTGPQTFSITGVVKDSVSGRPLPNFNVSTSVSATPLTKARDVTTVSDEQGRYRLGDLPPGTYRIDARSAQVFATSLSRNLTLGGTDLEHIDFNVPLNGAITGRVLDENREPVPGIGVRLVSREYYSGVLGYFFKDTAVTDDRGIYKLQRVEAGHSYLVMAERAGYRLPAHSEAPLDPKLRRRVPMRTFYPNSPDRQAATAIVLRPGETREGIDIEVKKSPSYCIEGALASLGGPGALSFNIEAAQPAYGPSSTGGLFAPVPGGTTGPDGKFRICDLSPGAYRLTANDRAQPLTNRAMMPIEIGDRDLGNLNLTVGPGLPLDGEVVWDGPAPETPVTAKVSLFVQTLLRSPIANERGGARADIPGAFSMPGFLPSDYALRANLNAPGLYIKDITYGGRSVLYDPIHFGAAASDLGLRVSVARDGATLTAHVQDKDSNPLPDVRVLVLPAAILSEAMLQAALVTGQTNQLGQYRSPSLMPGKYLVVATDDSIDPTPERIDNLWRSRNRFQEVELPPNGAAEVKLAPQSLAK